MLFGNKKTDFYQPQWDKYYTNDRNYYSETAGQRVRQPALDQAIDADVCIIGAGFSGLSVAYHLRDSGLKVVLLERHEAGWGASGRCGGQLLPGYNPYTAILIRKYGEEKAKALWDISIHGLGLVRKICTEHNISCDLSDGALYTANTEQDSVEIQEYAEDVSKRYGYPMEFQSAMQVESMLGTPVYHSGIYMPQAGHFHPLKYIRGLVDVIKGFTSVYESTPAEAVRKQGDCYIVHTPGGYVQTRSLVLCGDSYLGTLVPQLRRKYVLIRNAMIGTESILQESGILPKNPCVFEVSKSMNYFRKCADGTFLMGAGDIVRQSLNGSLTQEKIVEALSREMTRIFPNLSGVEIPYRWGGYIGVTNTFMPNVGKLDDNVYYANGYSGHGINVSHGVGYLLARAVSGAGDEYRIFDAVRNMSYPGMGQWDRQIGYAGLCLYNFQNRLGRAWSEIVHGRK